MRPDHSDTPSPADRRARVAVGALFLANAAVFANLVPRYPEIKAALSLDNAAYGWVIAAYPAGAVAAGLAAGPLVRRHGSARVAVVGMVLTGLAVVAAGMAPSVALFAVGLAVAGATDAITDVAQNAHGLRVQRRYGRSILNSFHALWSIGAVLGGAMAIGALALDLPRGIHLGGSAVIFTAVSLVALRHLLPGPDPERPDPEPPEPPGAARAVGGPHPPLAVPPSLAVLTALALIVLADTAVEDTGTSWATLYLSGPLGLAPAVAPLGYVAMVGAQVLGRLSGDRLVDRLGRRAVARAGGLLTAAGMGVALAVPTVPLTVLGLAAAGLGVATLVPAAMHQADELPGLRPGTGLAVVSWVMRLGFLLWPPVVGAVAEATSLRAALVVVPVAGAVVTALAGVLPRRMPRTPAPARRVGPA